MSASRIEENLDRLNPSKVNDGDMETRWLGLHLPHNQWQKLHILKIINKTIEYIFKP